LNLLKPSVNDVLFKSTFSVTNSTQSYFTYNTVICLSGEITQVMLKYNLLTWITSRHDYTYIQLAKGGNHCEEFGLNIPLVIWRQYVWIYLELC